MNPRYDVPVPGDPDDGTLMVEVREALDRAAQLHVEPEGAADEPEVGVEHHGPPPPVSHRSRRPTRTATETPSSSSDSTTARSGSVSSAR